MSKIEESATTKKYKKLWIIFSAASWILTLGPLVGWLIYGFISSGIVQKAALISTGFAAMVLTAVNVIFKKHIRSTVFVLLLGIYLALNKITALLIVLAVCTILDEFIITPLQKKYHNKFTINKEMDARLKEG